MNVVVIPYSHEKEAGIMAIVNSTRTPGLRGVVRRWTLRRKGHQIARADLPEAFFECREALAELWQSLAWSHPVEHAKPDYCLVCEAHEATRQALKKWGTG